MKRLYFTTDTTFRLDIEQPHFSSSRIALGTGCFLGRRRDAQKTRGGDRWKALIQGREKELASLVTGDRWRPPDITMRCAEAPNRR